MAKHDHRIIALIFAAALVAACAPTPMSIPSPAPTALPATPTDSPPTVTPTAIPPTSTALPATATNPPPTSTVPPTEDVETEPDQANSVVNVMEANRMNIQIGEHILTATLVENSSVDALKAALAEGLLTVNMRDYGSMEKVGPLGMELPRNDEQITTEAGDIILYQGNALVIYYAPNSWNFTRLGKIDDVTAEELREILGDGNVTVTLSLPQE